MNETAVSANQTLTATRLGIDTSHEAVIYMRQDCPVCRSEGFTAHARVEVRTAASSIIATVSFITTDLLAPGQAGLSEAAWRLLGVAEGEGLSVHHAAPVDSLSSVRAKVYGQKLHPEAIKTIIEDITAGRYSDIHLSAFITACAGTNLDRDEMTDLTRAMIGVGDTLDWGRSPIVDKHCIGGLPGNRTTPIVVSIVAAYGLIMPKTSSRAITSPAGTADTMETLAPVNLNVAAMRRVVEAEGGCVVWGGSVHLSPADDILIRVERALDLDSEGQLVASVLSKKAAAGSTHVVLDLPTGPSAKVRSRKMADILSDHLVDVAARLGLQAKAVITDGSQPVGVGIGPALEAQDVLAVLTGAPDAPADLRERALLLAGEIIEMASAAAGVGTVGSGEGLERAREILEDGRAWAKFQAICTAQGGLRTPPVAAYREPVVARRAGRLGAINNRLLARVAKLAGAPSAPAAGVKLNKKLGDPVDRGEPLFTVHAETPGELSYALEYVDDRPAMVVMEAD